LNHFQLNYGEFLNENNYFNHFLEDNYCESKSSEEFIEWIPYDEFEDIININKLAFSNKAYSAVWPKGCIYDWNKDKFNWSRKIKKVTLVNIKYDQIDFIKVSYSTF
jgi:hypothetical protein